MTMDGALAAEACVAAGGGEGTYTIREGACRFGQPPMNNARLHHKNGKALSFTSLEILSLSTIAGATRQESKTCRPLGTMLRAIDLLRKATLGRRLKPPAEVEARCSPPEPDPTRQEILIPEVERGMILFEAVALLAKHERRRRPFSLPDRKYGKETRLTGDKVNQAVQLEGSPSGEISEALQRPPIPVGPVDEQPQVCPKQYNLQSHPNPESPNQPRLL
jgi:hypothetical protein